MNIRIEEIYQHFLKNPIVSTDSRKIEAGALFFALSGENFDGNEFALQALEKGAAFVIIDNPDYLFDERCLLVDDTLTALQQLAQMHREKMDIPVLGITGTNGKTTTKELIISVLRKKYNVLGTEGNLNNHIGVPLTLLRVNKDHEIAVIEMGASHNGEIAFLCDIAQPNYGIITNVGKAHLEGFGSFYGVKKTKKELYDYLRKHHGKAIVNGDDYHLVFMSESISKMTYGNTIRADILAEDIKLNPFLQLQWSSASHPESYTISSQLPGLFHWANVMAAVTTGVLFGVNPYDITSAIAEYKPANNRSQILDTDNNNVFLDAYNANPTSMMAALEYFTSQPYSNKSVIIGEMKELGEYTKEEHQNVVDFLVKNQEQFHDILLVGSSFELLKNLPFRHFSQTDQAADFLELHPIKNKTVLIKGSRGNKLESLLKHL